MIDSGASLIEGSIRRDLVLASETGSLRRLLEASGLAFRVLSLNVEENKNQALFETLGETDPADVAELLARTRIEEANARVPGALIIGAHQVVSLNGKVLEKPTTVDAARDRLFELKNIVRKPRQASLHCNRDRLSTLFPRFRTTKTQSRHSALRHFAMQQLL
jgi:predicted house-cleaning NTP pyrophosphatase (Maf/HAM1 superfamily)